jgi:hypothetical protein
MAVPNIFGTATAAIPLSQLDQNFATAITIGNTAVYLGNTTTSLGNVTLTNVTISSGNVTVSNITANAVTSPSATNLLLQSAGTTAVTIDTSQNVTMANRTTNPTTISVGGATPSTSGSGITFPATQSASSDVNTLDDYEEGTFTPSVRFGGAAVGQTGTFAGFYTKVGNQVFLTIAIALTAKGSSTGGASIGGLPFTSNSDANYRAMSSSIIWGNLVTSYVYMLGLLPQSATAIDIYAATAATTGSADANLVNTNLNNTSLFRISITYQTS